MEQTWFVFKHTNDQSVTSGQWQGPFSGTLSSIRLFGLSLRRPPDSLVHALDIFVYRDGLWVDLATVPD